MHLENTLLCGHQQATTQIQAQLKAETLPASLILSGPRGIGKATLALHLARALLATSAPVANGMNLLGEPEAPHNPFAIDFSAPEQQRISHGSHPDLKIIQPAEGKMDIAVDYIRGIGQFLSLSASEASKRVVLIDAADDMNRNAANALLKNLEEPPHGAHLILISHQPHRLLATIRSRCMFLPLHRLDTPTCQTILAEAAITPTVIEQNLLDFFAHGAPGMMIRLIEADIPAILQHYFKSVAQPTLPHDSLKWLQKLSKKGHETHTELLLACIAQWLASCAQEQATGNMTPPLNPTEQEARSRLLARHDANSLMHLWQKSLTLRQEIQRYHQDKTQAFLQLL